MEMHESQRRQLILGVIVTIWGAGVVLRGFIVGVGIPGSGAYANGNFIGWILGFVMVAVGWRAIAKYRQSTNL